MIRLIPNLLLAGLALSVLLIGVTAPVLATRTPAAAVRVSAERPPALQLDGAGRRFGGVLPRAGDGRGAGYCTRYSGGATSSYRFRNVYACEGSTTGSTTFDHPGKGVYAWQCVELSARFLWAIDGIWAGPGSGVQDGADLVSVVHANNPSIPVATPGPGSLPAAGDIMSLGPGGGSDPASGHTAVVISSNAGTGRFKVMSENAPDGTAGEQTLRVDLTGGHNGEVLFFGAWTQASWLETARWTAMQAPLPSDAAANPGVMLRGAACLSTCVVGGKYNTTSTDEGLLLTGSGTSWTATQAPLPSNGVNSPGLDQVTCASPAACAATGSYQDASGDTLGLLLTGAGSSWTATQAPLPPDAASNPQVNLDSIACPSATSCAAVGTYFGSGTDHGVLLTMSGTSWAAAEVPTPLGALGPAFVVSIACPATTQCIAVGSYQNSSGLNQPLILTGLGSSWSVTEPPLPIDAYAAGNAALSSVNCPTATSCTAVGSYQNANESPTIAQGLIETGQGSSWTATGAPMPANTVAPTGLNHVACSASTCLATGSYQDSSGNALGWLVSGAGTTWTASQAPAPSGAATNPGMLLYSDTCRSQCVAVGTYTDSSNNEQGLLLTGKGSSWTPTQAPLPPNAGSADYLGFVTCNSQLACLATGYFTDSSGNPQGWLIPGRPADPASNGTMPEEPPCSAR